MLFGVSLTRYPAPRSAPAPPRLRPAALVLPPPRPGAPRAPPRRRRVTGDGPVVPQPDNRAPGPRPAAAQAREEGGDGQAAAEAEPAAERADTREGRAEGGRPAAIRGQARCSGGAGRLWGWIPATFRNRGAPWGVQGAGQTGARPESRQWSKGLHVKDRSHDGGLCLGRKKLVEARELTRLHCHARDGLPRERKGPHSSPFARRAAGAPRPGSRLD